MSKSKTLLALLLLTPSLTAMAIRTTALKCEMLSNPCGINTTQPNLSWQIPVDYNGIAQSAYAILAATTATASP